jgi:CBS-domain-containing membrane protein
MTGYFAKMRGGEPLPPRVPFRTLSSSFVGSFCAIGAVATLASATAMPWVLGSFGATCVLLFGYPDNPFSQPRNVICGHFLTSLTGLVFLSLCGPSGWALALALPTAILIMHLTRTVHPPAGSNPVIVMLTMPGWKFLLTPTLLGAMVIVAVAVVFNNLRSDVSYPRRWG